jgi:hypothetical protein
MTENERTVLLDAADRKCRSKRKRSSLDILFARGRRESGRVLLFVADSHPLKTRRCLVYMSSLYFRLVNFRETNIILEILVSSCFTGTLKDAQGININLER